MDDYNRADSSYEDTDTTDEIDVVNDDHNEDSEGTDLLDA